MHSQGELRAAMPDAESKLDNSAGEAASGSGARALLLRGDGGGALPRAATERDQRLDRLRMQLDVMVRARTFRVGDLLALGRNSVVESLHEHTQDLPVRCGGVLLMWAEFEVVDHKLAVRITRLA